MEVHPFLKALWVSAVFLAGAMLCYAAVAFTLYERDPGNWGGGRFALVALWVVWFAVFVNATDDAGEE